jgi:hypothetical protein
MNMAIIDDLRRKYHQRICAEVIFEKAGGIASMADVSNSLSKKISRNLLNRLPYLVSQKEVSGQTAGERLEQITKDFLEQAFTYLQHIRPGKWIFSVHNSISGFGQYQHLAELANIVKKNKMLKTALGDYVISPDIVVGRNPVSDDELNQVDLFVDTLEFPKFTPLRAANSVSPMLHASISCKWTLRSDRSQNARTEGLNLIRNRKGHTPQIAVVTGEPLPSRISSLAFGTGDIDCVYHFALHELIQAVQETGEESALETLQMMTDGHRLRDISDLPFDLAI